MYGNLLRVRKDNYSYHCFSLQSAYRLLLARRKKQYMIHLVGNHMEIKQQTNNFNFNTH